MKKLIFTIFYLFLISGCSKNEADQEFTEPTTTTIFYSVLTGQHIYAPLKKGKSEYILKTDNPKIVAFEYLEDIEAVSISTLDCGEASITATYANNDTIAIIKIFVNYWESKKIEEIGKSETLSPEVFVESKDTETKQLIEKELWNYIDQRKGSLYSFDGDTKQFTIEITQLGEKHQGTYRWSIDSLTLSYNDTIEKYAFQMFPRRDYYKIHADKTEEYQSKYPKASITSVKISRIWYDSDKLHIQ